MKATANGPLSIYGLCGDVWISDTRMKIGHQLHSHAEWAAFDDESIVAMDRQALRFWRDNKAVLMALCALHSSKATKKTGAAEESSHE